MKYIYVLLSVLFVISIFFVSNKKVIDEEFRGVYFSYIEYSKYITGKSEEDSKNNIIKVLDNLKDNHFNNIIVHVRPFSDSMYKSLYYPVSEYILNNKWEYPNYDVLEFFINEAHKRNIKFHAWINPYRISNSTDLSKLSIDSIYYYFVNKGDAKITPKGIYLNPASGEVRNYIINGIKELIDNYDVDGIHFDDYFYPDKEIDLSSYEIYKKEGGTLDLINYRYSNIIDLLKETNKVIKDKSKKIKFGIAPEGNIDNCYEDSFLDVKTILKGDYIDYIMPQIYFGFNNQTRPFIDTLNDWDIMIQNNDIKLIPALAFYKVGNYDKYALSGSNEWIENKDIIGREVVSARTSSHYKGFSLFSYNYIFSDDYKNNHTEEEFAKLKELLK